MISQQLRKCFPLFLAACLGSLAHAQNPAPMSPASRYDNSIIRVAASPADHRSLEETLLWIQQQFEKYAGATYKVTADSGEKQHSWTSKNTYTDVKFESCKVTFTHHHQMNEGRIVNVGCTIPLWDISSVGYKMDDGVHNGNQYFHYAPLVPSLWINTRGRSIHWARPRVAMDTDVADLDFGGDLTGKPGPTMENTMEGIAKAFQHAVDLCAAQAPKNESSASGTSNSTSDKDK